MGDLAFPKFLLFSRLFRTQLPHLELGYASRRIAVYPKTGVEKKDTLR